MSFASVDSEGSWLASRIGSLRSVNREGGSLRRRNRVRTSKSLDGDFDVDNQNDPTDDTENENENENENDDMDETFSTAELEYAAMDSGVKCVGISAQPQPVQVYKPKRDTIQSREVLLDIDSADEEEVGAESIVSAEADEQVDFQTDFQEARTLSMSHIRRCSARSAKLFEIGTAKHSLDETRGT
ncbi:hypothetical protein ESCO_003884 [Escovopsis weberi]|uniref:Uncharacterized protein n=1 Tax=Escovopsis weberi TaxID=150374 RepID=A0A0N0RU86_ESCWE|nr:hypothetical protein ESCO_003884 [Escovopsis weberi]